jgi:hypothetical protein
MLNTVHQTNGTIVAGTPDREIDGANVQLYFLSRNPKMLATAAGAILLIAMAMAWMLRAPQQAPVAAPSPAQTLETLLASQN